MSQLDSNAIKEIVKLTTTAFSGENLPLTECPVALLPDNVNIESLERFMTERFRFRGVMTTTSIDDFVEYSKGYADEHSRCFINAETMKAVTVFNIGTLEQPGHADNKALLELKATSPYRALRDVDGKKHSRNLSLNGWKTGPTSSQPMTATVMCWISNRLSLLSVVLPSMQNAVLNMKSKTSAVAAQSWSPWRLKAKKSCLPLSALNASHTRAWATGNSRCD